MIEEIIIHFFLGLIAVIIGAVPLGLVNLSVVESTLKKGRLEGLKISFGATLTELVFVLLSLFAGTRLAGILEDNPVAEIAVVLVLVVAAITFLVRKNGAKETNQRSFNPILKGAFFNLISIQVLLYWLIAIAFLQTSIGIVFTIECIIAFCLAVAIGKMGVLFFYARSADAIVKRSSFLSKKINTVIGLVLLVVALLQGIKILFG